MVTYRYSPECNSDTERVMIRMVGRRSQIHPRIFLVISVVALSAAVPAITALATAPFGEPGRRQPPARLTASASQLASARRITGDADCQSSGALSDDRGTRPLDGEHLKRDREAGANAHVTSDELTVTRLTVVAADQARPEFGRTTTGSRTAATFPPKHTSESAQPTAAVSRCGHSCQRESFAVV